MRASAGRPTQLAPFKFKFLPLASRLHGTGSSSIMASAEFTQTYDALPPEAQLALVREQLIPLLDLVPKNRARKVVAAATRVKGRTASMPVLDLKAKQTEINGILDELRRDSKRFMVTGITQREELLDEAIRSVLHWLNDIWSVVYEYSVNFAVAHSCLLYSAKVLVELCKPQGECSCEVRNKYVSFKIKRKTGETARCFSFRGAQNIERILLWIWRDLFLSLLASNTVTADKRLRDMVSDIENAMGWEYLHRLLYGGRKSRYCDDEEEEEEEYDGFDEHEQDDLDHCSCCEETTDDTDDDGCACTCDAHISSHLRAKHWSTKIKNQIPRLKLNISKQLISTFTITPSYSLFTFILSISRDSTATSTELCDILSSAATSNSDTFASALNIFAAEGKVNVVNDLLDSHIHLLRPRDAPVLQAVVAVLSLCSSFQPRGLQIIETEIMDTAQEMSAAISACFCNVDKQANKTELSQIVQLRQDSAMRPDRIRQWVDTVITPGAISPHPMAIAAAMMGLGLLPEGADSFDPYGYLDIHQDDKDLEDLREEFRPKLKDRFEGWNETARSVTGGSNLLLKLYAKIVQLMPYIRAPDVVDEMISRLADKPSKHHICDALSALSSFSKVHTKKLRRLAAQRNAKSTTPAAPKTGTSRTESSDPVRNSERN